ncbi:MAG TPA: flagellar basal body L-ring protein FlgH [Methylophaga sp.]|nr:flagellar basal body L-ring protein FlgH [Methylophaga sp.]
MSFLIRFLALSSLILLSACTTTEVKRDPAYAAVRPVALPEHPNTDGAIFNVANNVSFYEDYRARRVGDILTVKLDEKTSAEKTSATTVKKSNSNDIASPTILGSGVQFNAPGILPLASNNNNDLSFSAGSESDFDGSGDSDLENKLSGDISVSVVEVLPNGNMIIRGEKVMTINQGNEYLRIGGMISPRDIDSTNSISSKRIADVQMSYVGDGPTNDGNVMGWLSRFFISALMPF